MPCGSIDDLVDAREGERVLWTGLVKVFKIDAEAPGFVLFLVPLLDWLASPDVLYL